MAKSAAPKGMPVDQPAMTVPRQITYSEAAFFASANANGYDLEGFHGDTEIGKAKGNRNVSGFTEQPQMDQKPFRNLRRR